MLWLNVYRRDLSELNSIFGTKKAIVNRSLSGDDDLSKRAISRSLNDFCLPLSPTNCYQLRLNELGNTLYSTIYSGKHRKN